MKHNITWEDAVHGFNGPVKASYAPYDYPGSGKCLSIVCNEKADLVTSEFL